MKLKKLYNEMFIGKRTYKTYTPSELKYPTLIKLFDDLYGIDLKDEMEGKYIYHSDLNKLLYHFGADGFDMHGRYRGKDVGKDLIKVLKSNGHTILDKNHKPI